MTFDGKLGETAFGLMRDHVGHKIEAVTYGTKTEVENVTIECEDCGQVLFDADRKKDTD